MVLSKKGVVGQMSQVGDYFLLLCSIFQKLIKRQVFSRSAAEHVDVSVTLGNRCVRVTCVMLARA